MTISAFVRLTMWLAERGRDGSAGEAFAGDLLESLAAGRSRWWCFAQALQRAVFLAAMGLRGSLPPLGYCVAFVLLYPVWQRLQAPAAARLLHGSGSTVAWPRSAMLAIVTGLLPAVMFVWVGVFGYLLLRPRTWPLDVMRVSLSLSFGCSMVCAETMLRLGGRPPELGKLAHADFYYPVCHAHFSAILFVALFAALALLPREPASGRRLRLRHCGDAGTSRGWCGVWD